MLDMSLLEWTNQFSDEWLEQTNGMNEIPPIELTNATGTNLHQLNEDCLLEIFSIKSLNTADLCSLAETCTRFRQIIRRIVPQSISIKISHNGIYKVEFESDSKDIAQKNVKRILKNFGSSISVVKVTGAYMDDNTTNSLVKLLTKYCVDNLKRLIIYGLNVTDVFAVKLKPIFEQLNKLDVACLHNMTSNATTLFAKMKSLVKLRICRVENVDVILRNTFPQLKRFEYNDRLGERSSDILSKFISRHKSLKILKLIFRCFEKSENSLIMKIFRVIGDNCVDMEKLWLETDRITATYLQPLQTLKSLRSLRLSGVTFEDFKLFSQMTELRVLTLTQCDLPKSADQFAFLSQLLKLHLEGCTHIASNVISVISRLINLSEIVIIGSWTEEFKLDEKTFSEMLEMVKGRQNILTLRCYQNFEVKYYDNNQKIRLKELSKHIFKNYF